MSVKTAKSGAASQPQQSSSRAWEALTPALSEWILEAVKSMGFERMTPVQASTIPLFSGHKDPVVEAVTGSGKTLAFLIPILDRLLKLEEPIPKHHVGAIVISPTRELATQIHTVLTQLLAFHGPSAVSLPRESDEEEDTTRQEQAYPTSALKVIPQLLLGGGQTPQADLSHFLKHSPNLLVATPGRLLELLGSPYVHTPQSSFQVLVMDEADRLLDLGFSDTLQKILQRLPKQRRTGLFSASVSDAVERLVKVGIQNPYRINVKVRGLKGEEDLRTPASLQMRYLSVPATHKIPTLLRLVQELDPQPLRTIAYLPTCAAVDYFQHLIPSLIPASSQLQVVPMHGKHKQSIRDKNLERFSTTPAPSLLLTTDLASRGLDISSVDLTVQLDPPTDEKSFLHRAGRAGRAGRKGLALVFLLPGRETEDYPPFLAVRKTPVSPLTEPAVPITAAEARAATETMRAIARRDRAIHDKAQAAFPSTVQAYRKHSAKSIFRVQDLPWADLAEAWALLRLPRMPEARGWAGPRDLGLALDWDAFAYRDRAREAKRRAELQARRTAAPAAAGDGADTAQRESGPRKRKPAAWSDNKAAAETREARRAKRARKRTAERESAMTPAEKGAARELDGLVAQVRRRNEAARAAEEEAFEGFD